MENKLENGYCYEYVVLWSERNYQLSDGHLYRKFFASKKDAKSFARKKRKEFKKSFFKPIIIQTVVCREVFRKDIEIEEAPFDYRYVDDIYAKLIKY